MCGDSRMRKSGAAAKTRKTTANGKQNSAGRKKNAIAKKNRDRTRKWRPASSAKKQLGSGMEAAREKEWPQRQKAE
jgi:hypothetical protein